VDRQTIGESRWVNSPAACKPDGGDDDDNAEECDT
jgi:hypothetical protein